MRLRQGKVKITTDPQMIYKHMDTIKSKVKISRPLKVVLDAGNGLSGTYIPAVLKKLGVEVVGLYLKSDGTLFKPFADPEDPETTKDLEAKVVEVGADLGLGFDGD